MGSAEGEGARPAPEPNEDSRAFWEAVGRHQLLIQKCSSCGTLRLYPTHLCADCLAGSSESVVCSGKGTIYSFTVIHRAPLPAFADSVPYTVALIDLDEGPRMLSEVKGPPAAMRVGARVEAVFEDAGAGVTLPKFSL